MRNKIFNIIVMLLSVIIFISFFIFSNGYVLLKEHLKTLDKNWLVGALLCMVAFWLLETMIIYIISKSIYTVPNLFILSLKFAMTGQFFGVITPFSSGSQPAQLYAMVENEIPVGHSGSILMVKFIIHQIILTLYSILVLVFKFNYFSSRIPHFLYFCIFGFAFNTSIIFFAVFFSVSTKMSKKFLCIILRILNKIRIVKDIDSAYEKFETDLISFHENSVFLSKNIVLCISASVLTFLQWTSYYSVPYFIYKSFGFTEASIVTMIAAHVFLTMFMSCIPLPGAEGGAEGGFYIVFGLFFKASTIVPAIFIWRIIINYLCIAVSGIFTVILPSSKIRTIHT